MSQLRFVGLILVAVGAIAIASFSYRYGVYVQESAEERRSHAYTQAVLAFAHYRSNAHIERLLLRKCYEAALSEVQEQKSLQVHLLSENLRSTDNDPELLEYLRARDSQLLTSILNGQIPELKKSYTTTCP